MPDPIANPYNFDQSGTPKPAKAPDHGNPGGGKSIAEIVRKSNSWRDNYNPLRQLTIARLLAIFEQAERGAFAEIQIILRKAEKRFPILKGFAEKLLSSIEELNWDVKVMDPLPQGVTDAQAEAQRKFLKGRYDLLKNLSNTFGQIALAEVRGYTVLQKHRYNDGSANDGAVQELYWIEPWCWSRDGYYGDFYYNELSRFGIGLGTCRATLGEKNRVGSEELPREDFVIREVESPIYEIALIAFVNWLMARKDWSAFVEIFGLPNSIVVMPPNIPPGMEEEYRAAAEKVADGVSGALPNGSDVKFPTAGARTEVPFKAFCDAQESDLVMAGTGGQLTMLSMPTGIGKGASEEHDGAWQKIAALKARRINETLQRDFDVPELAAEFPGQAISVYFELAVKDEEDIGLLADTVVKFEGVNLQTDVAEISERAGMKLTRVEPDPAAQPGGAQRADQSIDKKELGAAVRNRAPVSDLSPQTSAIAEATAKDLQPVLKAIDEGVQKIFEIADPNLRLAKFRSLWAATEQIRKDAAKYPEAALELQKINAEAAARGLKGEEPIQNRILNGDVAGHEFHGNQYTMDSSGVVVSGPKQMIGHSLADNGEFFHGTSATNVESILKKGILPTDKTMGFKAAFVGKRKDLAFAYGAGSAASHDHDKVAIVVVKDPGKHGMLSDKIGRDSAYSPGKIKPDQIDRVEIYRANAGKDEAPLQVIHPAAIKSKAK